MINGWVRKKVEKPVIARSENDEAISQLAYHAPQDQLGDFFPSLAMTGGHGYIFVLNPHARLGTHKALKSRAWEPAPLRLAGPSDFPAEAAPTPPD